MEKVKVKANIKKLALLGLLGGSLVLMTGCGNRKLIMPGSQTYNKAIILRGNNAAIVDVEKWKDFDDGEQLEIWTKDGSVILTSSYDTKLVNTENTDKPIEEICQAIVGPEGTVTYLAEPGKVLTR